MSSNIHSISNTFSDTVSATFFSTSDRLSYDVVLGKAQKVDYDDIFGAASAPIPLVKLAADFSLNRLRLEVGSKIYSIYVYEGIVRIVEGETFSASAKPLEGYSGQGAMDLIIDEKGQPVGRAYKVITGQQLAAVEWATSRYALYGVNADQELMEKSFLTDHWLPWNNLGKPSVGLKGPVTAVSWALSRFGVYALGNDGSMYERAYLTTGWGAWTQYTPPPGRSLKSLAGVSWVTGRFGMYAVADDGRLYQKWYGTTSWSDWSVIGAPTGITLSGEVTDVSWSLDRYGVYALGNDGNVWQIWWATTWSGWEKILTPPFQLTSLCSDSTSDRVYAIAGVGTDNNLWVLNYSHGWAKNWVNLGRPGNVALDKASAAVSWAVGRSAFYAIGKDGQIYQNYNNAWTMVDGS